MTTVHRCADRFRPTPLETAAGLMLGLDDAAPRRLPPAGALSPVAALAESVLDALTRPPCYVAFSGGRDSSAMLALATRVARVEGLPLPVPITLRYPGVPETYESDWQELVVAYVDPPDWVRLEFTDELDYLGPWAESVLRRHGALWPMNSHAHLPYFQFTVGGSIIDGVDGDAVFSSGHARALAVLRGRTPPTRGAVRDLGFLAAPPPLRRAWVRRRGLRLPWLTSPAQAELLARLAVEFADEPVSYAQRLHWFARSRYVGAVQFSTRLLAADHDTRVVRPLLDPQFLSALARAHGRQGFQNRTATMRWLFAGLLPPEVLARSTKASFPNFWNNHSARFAAEWDGGGVDRTLVDVDRLRATWQRRPLDHRSALLLQQAWLATTSTRQNSAPSPSRWGSLGRPCRENSITRTEDGRR